MKRSLSSGLLLLLLISGWLPAQEPEPATAPAAIKPSSEILTGFDAAQETKSKLTTRSFKTVPARTSMKSRLEEGEADLRGIKIIGRDGLGATSASSVSVNVVPDSDQNFSNILFRLGSTQFANDTTLQQLHQIALAMKARPELQFLLEGHTCDLGSDDTNFRLSENRADTVRAYLIREGVAPHQIFTLGFGETDPLVPNSSEPQRQLNRRVVIYVRS